MFHKEISQRLLSHQDEMASAITARQFELQPELQERYGITGWDKSLQDTRYHLAYLAEAIGVDSQVLFVDYVVWVKTVLDSYQVLTSDLIANLQVIMTVFRERWSPEMVEIAESFIQAAIARLSEVDGHVNRHIDPDNPYLDLAERYLKALLDANRYEASRLIMQAVEAGVTIKDIYLYVFQPVQREIGRLWQLNQISVAHEHFATATTQLVMSQLYTHIFSMDKRGARLIATCVGGELHEIGIRMVADFFEMEGWDTFYLGANTPIPAVVDMIGEQQADVLAISATMTMHIGRVQQLLEQVRDEFDKEKVKILVGGYPFNIEPELWRKIGADGYASDAETAIAVANQLIRM